MCNCLCEFCADAEECQINYWCEKLKKYCIAKTQCNETTMKILRCFEKLKQPSLFENQENHNQ